jgi:hypothetical protein
MFYVTKNNRPAGTKKFFTYEQARAYARKLVRKAVGGWSINSNPPISLFGYAVKRSV